MCKNSEDFFWRAHFVPPDIIPGRGPNDDNFVYTVILKILPKSMYKLCIGFRLFIYKVCLRVGTSQKSGYCILFVEVRML